MKIKTLLFTAIISISCFAQEINMKLGKVSIAELEEKQHPLEPEAAAAYIFNTGDVTMEYNQSEGFILSYKVRVRLKIYKKEGYEWANKSVPFYIGNNVKETVSFDNAYTYNLVNGKIEKTKLKSEGEFTEKLNRYYSLRKITMPNVKEGSVIEYEYTIRTDRYYDLPDWYFQYDIPVKHSIFTTSIPEFFSFKPNQKGYVFPTIKKEALNKTISLSYRERSTGRVTTSSVSYENVNYIENQTIYTLDNVPALKDESFVNNINNYRSSIFHELMYTKFPNSTIKSYSTDWESVVKTIYNYDTFGPELNKNGYYEDDLNLLIKDLKNNDEKTIAIFEFVKQKVKWNKVYGFDCNDGVRKAYKDGTGNDAEINLMLVSMLRYAGINANPVLISTRSNGISLFPSVTAYNYVIAAVENQNLILLDATEKYALPNILPERDLNWYGRLIRKDGTSTEVNLLPTHNNDKIVNMMYEINPNGTISGKERTQYYDNLAFAFRTKYGSEKEESYLERFETKNNNIEVSEYKRDFLNDLSKPLTETYAFKDTKSFEMINDKIYFSPLLFHTETTNPFKLEKREYPIDFSYPVTTKYNINITIPNGYVVETLPAQINLALPDNLGSLKYLITNDETNIQLVVTEQINEAIIAPDYYETLKQFFQKVIEKETEKIVLKKV